MDTIEVAVDRFTKYTYFIALTHPFSAQDVTHTFLNHFYKFYGLSASIVTNKDKIFSSIFWRKLFRRLGVKLFMSSTYHPQTDG